MTIRQETLFYNPDDTISKQEIVYEDRHIEILHFNADGTLKSLETKDIDGLVRGVVLDDSASKAFGRVKFTEINRIDSPAINIQRQLCDFVGYKEIITYK